MAIPVAHAGHWLPYVIPGLTCFRAANVVLRFEGMAAADRARVSGAVSALASDG